MIEIKSLSLAKNKNGIEIQILRDISFAIPPNRVALLLGKSGSGKTSILRCISQLERGYEGQILYRHNPIRLFTNRERCQVIGFVPQSYALFPFMTVLENCAHPLKVILKMNKAEANKRAEELLASLEMQHLANYYPHELSGGQQQRTAILRALALDPQYLLLDEPTSALDPENTNLLMKIIQKLKSEGKGIIISSQDMLFASKVYDSIYFLEAGRIAEIHDSEDRSISKEGKLGKFLFPAEESEPTYSYK